MAPSKLACGFHRTTLSSIIRFCLSVNVIPCSWVGVHGECPYGRYAENQCFPAAASHDLDPLRLLSTCVLFQVFECPDMVNLDFIGHAGCPALFTLLGQEPFFEF